MKKKYVLIPGGYGAVGTIVSSLLSKNKTFIPVVAGRSENQAKKLAAKLKCKWTVIDLENKESIELALKDRDIVISCYVPSGEFNTLLPQIAAESGIHYLDIAAFNKFNKNVMRLNKKAIQNGAILITALGLFPGVPGLILVSNKDYFDKIDKIAMWSMSESFFLGIILFFGLKLGFAKTIKRARKFLFLLRFLGRNKNKEYSMKIVTTGTKNNQGFKRIVEMNASEEFLTAIVPVLICEQIVTGNINNAGAFTGADIIDTKMFVESLKDVDVNYKDIIRKL